MVKIDEPIIVSMTVSKTNEVFYLVKWPYPQNADELFTWKPSCFFDSRPDIVSSFWSKRSNLIKEASTQTSDFVWVPDRRPLLPDHDVFCGFKNQCPRPTKVATDSDNDLIPTKILKMQTTDNGEVQFLCSFDESNYSEDWMTHTYLLSVAPKLLAEYLIEMKKINQAQLGNHPTN